MAPEPSRPLRRRQLMRKVFLITSAVGFADPVIAFAKLTKRRFQTSKSPAYRKAFRKSLSERI